MCGKNTKYLLLNIAPDNSFGLKNVHSNWFIGRKPVDVRDNILIVENEEFLLTEELAELLTQKEPRSYSSDDLLEYKKILLLTNAHRKHYDPTHQINANRSWKYVNVISKIFKPKRRRGKNSITSYQVKKVQKGSVLEEPKRGKEKLVLRDTYAKEEEEWIYAKSPGGPIRKIKKSEYFS